MSILVAGIDECGYGPILGPLVVASSIFLIEENPEVSMWDRLQESVGQVKKGLGNRILVTDSKKAYDRQSGLKHLEQTTRAFLNQLQVEKFSFPSILPVVSNDLIAQADMYPWYLSLYADEMPEISQTISNALTENMKQEGINFVDFRCICMDVAEFNKIVDATGSKAAVVVNSVLKLIQQILSIASFLNVKRILIYCDRLGGRMYYEGMLKNLPDFTMYNLEESSMISKYKLISDKKTERRLDIQFEVGADDKRFPVALASMIGKYIREKVMQHMNEYFIKLQPDLKSTAGYWTDGHRFLRDLTDETLNKTSLKREDLIRIK